MSGTATIIVTKSCPSAPSKVFSFDVEGFLPFTLTDGGSHNSFPSAPGVYDVQEAAVVGFLTTVSVSNGSPASAVAVNPGDTVTVAFTNTPGVPGPPGGSSFIPSPAPVSGDYQVIPLDNSPNQVWQVSVNVNGLPVYLSVTLRYNEIAEYWVMTIRDPNGNLILDSLPFVTGTGKSQNILNQFQYLGIGSAVVFNASNAPLDHPNNLDLGADFVLLWGNAA